MLQGIRDKAQGWIAWVIVVLISIPFAMWGVQEYLGVDPNVAVAKVNGTEIPLREFQSALQQRNQQLSRQLGRAIEADSVEEATLKQGTLDALIEDQLLLQVSADEGMRVSDEMVAQAITTNPSFVENGRFSQTAYDRALATIGYSPGGYEETLRRQMLTRQLITAYADSAIVTDQEIARLRSLQQQKRRYSALVIKQGDFLSAATVPDADVQARYTENRAKYVTVEQAKFHYLVLERSGTEASVKIDESALRSIYDNNLPLYTRPEQRKASHILIAVNSKRDEVAALSAIQAIATELAGGADFAELAKAKSDDPGSGAKGGDLGFFSKGLMDPTFELAAYEQTVGNVSEPVRSAFGYHLIKVTDVRPEGIKTFENVRPEVLVEFRKTEGARQYYEQVERLANLAFEQPDNLDDAAQTLGLELRTTKFVPRTGDADDLLWSEPKLLSAAFGPEVMANRENSEPVDLDGDKIVVVRLSEHRPSAERSLDDVRADIVASLRDDAAKAAALEKATKLLKDLRQGESLDAAAMQASAKWSPENAISRNDFDVSNAVRDTLFRMPRPTDERPAYDAVVDDAGDVHVLTLSGIEEAATPIEPATLTAARRGLAQITGNSTFRSFVAALRADAEVDVFSERL